MAIQVPKTVAQLIRADAPASAARTALGLGDVATHAAAEFQAADGDLTALAALSGTGFAKRTGSNTWSVGSLATGDVPDLSATYSVVGHAHAAADVTSGTFAVARGGTGLATVASGKLLYASALDTLAALTLDASLGISGGTLSVQANTVNQKVIVSKAGTTIGTRKQINFIEGANSTLTITDNSGSDRVDVTVAATSGSSLPVADTTALVTGSADATKQVRFEVDGLTTGTTRVLTVRDENLTLVGYTSGNLINTPTSLGIGSGVTLSTGAHNLAVGEIAQATQDYNAAYGYNARATGTGGSAAFGANALANNGQAVAFGVNSEARATFAVAIGSQAVVAATGDYSVAIGNGATCSGPYSVAIGLSATVPAGCSDSVALGDRATVRASGDIAFSGYGSDPRLLLQRQSSTGTVRDAACLQSGWVVSTDASRTGYVELSALDSAGTRKGVRVEANGSAALLGFFGGTAAAKPTVTGSRGGNAALASLLSALATLGLITDSSS